MTTGLYILPNLPFFAQTLVGLYFAFYGVWNIYHWTPILAAMARDNIPHPYLILPIGIVWEFTLGLMLIGNIYPKLAALLLVPFCVIAIFIFHPFWRYRGELRILHFSNFMVNLFVTEASLFFILSLK